MNLIHKVGCLGIAALFVLTGCSTLEDKYWKHEISVPRASGEGQAVFYDLTTAVQVPGNGFHDHYGLADAKGRILLEPIYNVPIKVVNDRFAIVAVKDSGSSGKGVNKIFDLKQRALVEGSWDGVESGPSCILAKKRASDFTIDLYLLNWETAKPVGVLKGLDGFNHIGNLIIIHANIDGIKTSQFINHQGKPVSPVFGRVKIWRSRNGRLRLRELTYADGELPSDYLFLKNRMLNVPISDDGKPLPLPEGAIGLVTCIKNEDENVGWAIVYATPRGYEFSPGLGNIQQVLAQADTLPRYRNLAIYNANANEELYKAGAGMTSIPRRCWVLAV